MPKQQRGEEDSPDARAVFTDARAGVRVGMEVPCHVLEEGRTVLGLSWIDDLLEVLAPSASRALLQGLLITSILRQWTVPLSLRLRGCQDAAVKEVAERATVLLLVDGQLEDYESSAGF